MKYVFNLGTLEPFKGNVSAMDLPPAIPASDADVLALVSRFPRPVTKPDIHHSYVQQTAAVGTPVFACL
jgi:hypothetical protein